MPRQTLHCADTYVAGQRGKLAVGEHREFKTPAEAISRAERLAEKPGIVGAMAYTIEADHEFEDYSEPVTLARFGRTPED